MGIAKKRLLAASCLPFCLSVCPSTWNNSAPSGRIFIKLNFCLSFYHLSKKKIQESLKSDKTVGHSLWGTYVDIWQYMAKFFLEREILQTKVAEKVKTRVLCSIPFFSPPKIVPFTRKIWKKNYVEPDMPQIATWRMSIACWIPRYIYLIYHTPSFDR